MINSQLRRWLVPAVLLAIAACAPSETNTAKEETTEGTQSAGETVVMELSGGTVEIALRPDLAPAHVERFTTLVREGFYDGVVFHRVIDGFMAQSGDPTGTGTGGSSYPDLTAEFSDEPFVRGVVGAARSSSPNSANSQFFIMYASASHLNGQYTVFGEVKKGMDVVDKIKKGSPNNNGLVTDPDAIVRMTVAE